MPISLPVDDEANELLSRNALALLIAMLLDQQVPLERAFSGPRDLARRLGHEPTAEELGAMDPEALAAVFGERPALHRFPRAMAARTQDLGPRRHGLGEAVQRGPLGKDGRERVGVEIGQFLGRRLVPKTAHQVTRRGKRPFKRDLLIE